jgi:hypothetical protein
MEVGQTVYLKPENLGNAYRRDKSIKETIIEKIGRKYVTLKNYGQFEIETGKQKTEYSSDYKLYETKEEIESLLEIEDLTYRIKSEILKTNKIDASLENLRKIALLLNC